MLIFQSFQKFKSLTDFKDLIGFQSVEVELI